MVWTFAFLWSPDQKGGYQQKQGYQRGTLGHNIHLKLEFKNNSQNVCMFACFLCASLTVSPFARPQIRKVTSRSKGATKVATRVATKEAIKGATREAIKGATSEVAIGIKTKVATEFGMCGFQFFTKRCVHSMTQPELSHILSELFPSDPESAESYSSCIVFKSPRLSTSCSRT